MGNTRIFFVSVAVVFLLAFFALNTWAGGKIAVVQYELRPVATVDSGRYIKTEWNAKVCNRASEPVRFWITIIFVDSNNEELKQAKAQCELKAQETKTFSDTLLLEASLANKIASTRVSIDETASEDVSP